MNFAHAPIRKPACIDWICPNVVTPGARVRIIAGPFEGLEGVFQRESGSERAIVLLSVLGQTASVGVAVGSVVPRHAA